MKGYFQTWPHMVTLRSVRFIGKPLCKTVQFVCGLFGHELSKTEWGYGGGEYADRWCRWCNKKLRVAKTEVMFEFPDSIDQMKEVGLGNRGQSRGCEHSTTTQIPPDRR